MKKSHKAEFLTKADSMVTSRRRRQAVPGVTAISAACFSLFLIIIFLAFFVPPLSDYPTFPNIARRRRLQQPSKFVKNIVGWRNNFVLDDTFQVPIGGESENNLWSSINSRHFYGCSNASNDFIKAEEITQPDRYLMIATSGGLNQQRTGITDAVVAARILNATLVVPSLDQKSFWKDSSNFGEIFDVDWFISSLSNDVKIVKQLPEKKLKAIGTPYKMRVPRKCSESCYQNRVLPAIIKKKVVRLTKFDYRLSNKLATSLQKLRCRVNYHALKFTDPIQNMGQTLIRRMKEKSEHFIALHLRYEPDMLAFSGCYYGGGDEERAELGVIRKRWKSLHASNPEKERRHGKCPLKPEEVGLMLRALGFGKDVHMYVASGEIYKGEATLAPLKKLFPNFHSKETLASKEELAPFSRFSSRMAALDFIVCDESDVFVANNNGNMARMLAGRRRYFGHKRTIKPNAKKLYKLFQNRTEMSWGEFASKVKTFQNGFMGEPNEIKPGRGEFHENPSSCICEKGKNSGYEVVDSKVVASKTDSIYAHTVEFHSDGEELDLPHWNSSESVPLGKDMHNMMASDPNDVEEEEDYSVLDIIFSVD